MHEPKFTEIRPRTKRVGRTILHLNRVSSTQEVAWNQGRGGAAEGLVVVADEQAQGHGRRGRTWTSIGKSLHATLLLRPDVAAMQLQALPLMTGASAAEAVERLTRLDVGVKWPNDLMHEGRKLGGVLVDAVYAGSDRPEFLLVGLGINGDARASDFPPDLRETSTSLSQATGRHVCLPALLKLFLESFERRYERLLAGETEALLLDARNRLLTLGRRVRVQTSRGPLEGVATDLGSEGQLRVKANGTVHEVRSGECIELRQD